MIAVFFVGIGTSSVLTGFARSPLEIAAGLFLIGVFAAIYHPVGLAMVVGRYAKAGMALAINGVWGNFGVACAALATGFLIDQAGWRAAFFVPGVLCILCGLAYWRLFRADIATRNGGDAARVKSTVSAATRLTPEARRVLIVVTVNIFAIITMSGFIFQSTSFALPKVFEERLGDAQWSATWVGAMVFVVFALGSMGQLAIGTLLDRLNTKLLLAGVICLQTVFLAAMPGLGGWLAVIVASGFMVGSFGQLPITDFMVGKMARPEIRSSVYGARYVVTCLVFASALPIIAWIHSGWGFDTLFWVLTLVSVAMFGSVMLLPGRLPEPGAAPVAAE
jgi:MFS family permease